MISIFKSNPLLKELDYFFLIETYKWLLSNFGKLGYYHGSTLILPNQEFFPENSSSNEERASAIFDNVKALSGLTHWRCKLVAQVTGLSSQCSSKAESQAKNASNDAFDINPANNRLDIDLSQRELVVTYNPAIASVPDVLVSTFSRELAHYLTATAATEPPGGWVNWDYATDIAATFLGFGIFMANSSFSVAQLSDPYTEGWQAERNAHLSQTEHCMALGMFLLMNNISYDAAAKYLKPNLKKLLKKSLRDLSDNHKLEELNNIDYQYVYTEQRKIS